jgi:hypothetical protein
MSIGDGGYSASEIVYDMTGQTMRVKRCIKAYVTKRNVK